VFYPSGAYIVWLGKGLEPVTILFFTAVATAAKDVASKDFDCNFICGPCYNRAYQFFTTSINLFLLYIYFLVVAGA
jgi:hypothetical protein